MTLLTEEGDTMYTIKLAFKTLVTLIVLATLLVVLLIIGIITAIF